MYLKTGMDVGREEPRTLKNKKRLDGFPGKNVDQYLSKHPSKPTQVGNRGTPRPYLTTMNTFPVGNKNQTSPHRQRDSCNGNRHNENRDFINYNNKNDLGSPESKKGGSFACPTSSLKSPLKSPKSPKTIATAIALPSRTITEVGDDEYSSQRNSTKTQPLSNRLPSSVLSPSKASPKKAQNRYVESAQSIPTIPKSLEEYEDLTHQEKVRLGPVEQVMRKIREQECGSQDSEKETPPIRKDIWTPDKPRRTQDKLGRSEEKPSRQNINTDTQTRLKEQMVKSQIFREKEFESDSDLDDEVLLSTPDFKPKKISKDMTRQFRAIATKTKQPVDEIESFSSDEDLPPARPPSPRGGSTSTSFKNISVEATSRLFDGGVSNRTSSSPITSPPFMTSPASMNPTQPKKELKKPKIFNRTTVAKQMRPNKRQFPPIATGESGVNKKVIPARPIPSDLAPRISSSRWPSALSISSISDTDSENEVDKTKDSKQRGSRDEKGDSSVAKRKRSMSSVEDKGPIVSRDQSRRNERSHSLEKGPRNESIKTKVKRMDELPEIVFLSDEEEEAVPDADAGSVCPYCGDALPNPMPRRLAKALAKILLAEQTLRRKKQNEHSQKAAIVNVKPQDPPRPPRPRPLKKKAVVEEPETPVPRADAAVWDDTDSEPETGKLSLVDQFEFCRIHMAEMTIVPEGLRKNYPVSINFDGLDARVDQMKGELQDIIEGTVKSRYLERVKKTYKSLGTMGARQPAVMLATVQDTQPGYYGSKGAERLLEILVRMFIEPNILTYKLAHPQRPSEYIQQVLIPEAGLRLIAEDQRKIGRHDISLEDARIIMAESVEFGAYMHEA
ncbi:hypothetical protein BG006_006712 [Podila minutissima]|uniref:Restriction of telomere capping protein 4 n=1 Tax=Podila minutissima TaxID=64525 RepID=A0A9P5SI71_9FUNG|nr:hypothetical protein BG006_006712 [Podila minutissima]